MLFLALLLACPDPEPPHVDEPIVVEARELVPVFPEGTDPADPWPPGVVPVDATGEHDAPLRPAVLPDGLPPIDTVPTTGGTP